MFGFVSRVGSSLRKSTPKALLAHSLASALSTFFEVDPDAIEANLLSNTKIVLHDIRLKPQHFPGVANARLEGQVDEIEFSWIWGGDSQTSLVRETQLTIRGARFRLVLDEEETNIKQALPILGDAANELPVSDGATETSSSGYLQRNVQQIIDHLTLHITDMSLTIESVKGGSQRKVVVETTSLKLLSFGRDEDEAGPSEEVPALSQRICMDSFQAYIVEACDEAKTTKTLPLIDPIGYAASVKRVSGRRFVDGLASGLEIVGEAMNSGGIVLHAGTTQLQILSRMMELLLPDESGYTHDDDDDSQAESSCPSLGEKDVETRASLLEEYGNDESKETVNNHVENAHVSPSTSFVLPLPSVSVIMPNGSVVSMPDCTFSYKTDSSVCNLRGTKGILVNEDFPFVQFDESGWLVDFSSCTVLLNRTRNDDEDQNEPDPGVVAQIQWQEEEMSKVLQGLRDIASSASSSVVERMGATLQETEDSESSPSPPWSFVVDGDLALRIEGTDALGEEWVEALLHSPSIALSADEMAVRPSGTAVKGVSVGPSSFGELSLSVPSISFCPDDDCLCVAGCVDVLLQSMSVLEDTQKFLIRVFSLNDQQNSGTRDAGPAVFPLPINVSKADLRVLERNLQVTAVSIQIHDSKMRCDAINLHDDTKMSMCISGVEATFERDIRVRLDRVASLHVPGAFHLDQPINGATVGFVADTLVVDMGNVNIALLEESISSSQGGNSLSFPVHLRLNRLIARGSSCATKLEISAIDIKASPDGTTVSVVSRGETTLRLTAPDKAWLEATLLASSAGFVLSADGFSPSLASCAGAQIGPASFGDIVVNIPSMSLASGKICVDDTIEVSLQSMQILDDIQSLLKCLERGSDSEEDSPLAHSFPVSISSARIKVAEPAADVEVHKLRLCGSIVECESVSCKEASGMSVSMSAVSAKLEQQVEVNIQSIDSFELPGVLSLAAPIRGTTLSYVPDGVLQAYLPDMDALTPLLGGTESHETTEANGAHDGTVLPFPVHLRMDKLRLSSPVDGRCTISVSSIDLVAVSVNETLSLDSGNETTIRVEASKEEWLMSTVGPFSTVLSPSSDGYMPRSATCSRIHVGPSSFGALGMSIPSTSMASGSTDICVDDAVVISLASMDVAARAQSLLMRCFNTETPETSFSPKAIIPKLTLDVSDISAHAVFDTVQVSRRNTSCDILIVSDPNSRMAASLSGLHASFSPEISLEVEWIETLYIPGICSLQKPVRDVSVDFMGNSCYVKLPTVDIISLHTDTNIVKPQEQKAVAAGSSFGAIPFPVRLSINEFTLRSPLADVGETIFLRRAELDIKPDSHSNSSLAVNMAVDIIENRMTKLESMRASGTINNGRTETIHRFAFATKSATIVTGFSSVDWAKMFGGDGKDRCQKQSPTRMPFACIEALTVNLAYEGVVVSTGLSDVRIPRFEGGQNTTSDDLIHHLTQAVLSKAPSIISNSEILGENVVEMSAKSVGRAAMARTLAGSVTGSVTGLVAADSVRGAIASGKKSRNASSSDSYQFGDFSRGVVRSVKQAAKSGGEARGGDGKDYVPGDFTVGAAKSVSTYASSNKSRLGSAGGSGIGMAIGTAVAGPLGFVAGSYIGSKLGGAAFETENAEANGDGNDKRATMEQVPASRVSGYPSTRRVAASAPPETAVNADEDLLGLGASSNGQHSEAMSYCYQPPASTACTNLGHGGGAPVVCQDRSPGVPASQCRPKSDSQTHYAASDEADLLGLGYSAPANSAHLPVQPPLINQSQTNLGAVQNTYVPGASRSGASNTVPCRPTTGHMAVSPYRVPTQQPVARRPAPTTAQPRQQPADKQQGYQFGDFTRSVVARGKRRDGRSEKEGYKFGDFTRGMFG